MSFSNITDIGDYAFERNYYIDNIFWPSALMRIGVYAFSNCNSLKEVKISNNANLLISNYAFYYSSKIETIYVPSSVSNSTNIPFYTLPNLKTIYFYSDVQRITTNFSWCNNLEQIFIPSNSLVRISNTFIENTNVNLKIYVKNSTVRSFIIAAGPYIAGNDRSLLSDSSIIIRNNI